MICADPAPAAAIAEIRSVWGAIGAAAAVQHATDDLGATFTGCDGITTVALGPLTVSVIGSKAGALRRWLQLASTGETGLHLVPTRPEHSTRSTSVVQRNFGWGKGRRRTPHPDDSRYLIENDDDVELNHG